MNLMARWGVYRASLLSPGMRDLFWLGCGRLVLAVIGLASIRLSTTVLPTAQYGVLAMLSTFHVFCGLFLVNPVAQYINRYTHAWADEGTLLPRLHRFRVWVIVAALVGAIVSGVWGLTQPIAWAERAAILAAVSLMIVAATWNGTYVWLLTMLGYRAQSVGWSAGTAVLALALSCLLVRIKSGGLSWFAGQALGMGIGALGAGYAVRRVLSLQRKGRWLLLEPHALRVYILPLAVATGFMWWLLSGYRLLVEAHWGLLALGYAAVGLALAAQLWGVAESLAMQFLFPLFYRRISGPDSPDSVLAYSDLLNTLGPIYLVLAAAMIVGAPSLLLLLVDKAYLDALPFVLLGASIECCRVLGNVLATAAQLRRRMAMLVPAYAAGASVVTAGIVFVMTVDGAVQFAIVMLAIAGVVMLIVMGLYMRQLCPFRLDAARWITGLALAVASALFSWRAPWISQGVSGALAILIPIAILALIVIASLLWNNPSTERLLAVRLRPNLMREGKF